jgi:hypothetical protein
MNSADLPSRTTCFCSYYAVFILCRMHMLFLIDHQFRTLPAPTRTQATQRRSGVFISNLLIDNSFALAIIQGHYSFWTKIFDVIYETRMFSSTCPFISGFARLYHFTSTFCEIQFETFSYLTNNTNVSTFDLFPSESTIELQRILSRGIRLIFSINLDTSVGIVLIIQSLSHIIQRIKFCSLHNRLLMFFQVNNW